MSNVTLLVLQKGQAIFQSEKHWLIPLFDFEDYLRDHPMDTSSLEYRDKVLGKAAALLMVRLGAAKVHGDIMSSLACEIFQHHTIPNTYNTLVDRIDCQTEEILREVNDPQVAYQLLKQRLK